jgi:uncharacterized membrane protein YjfL (UPF0719 family)
MAPALFQLSVAFVLAPFACWMALRLAAALTPAVDEVAELRKGNVAVGVVAAAVLLSTGLIVREALLPMMTSLKMALLPGGHLASWLLHSALQTGAAVLVAIANVAVMDRAVRRVVGDWSEQEQLDGQNLAISLVVALAIVSGALVVAEGVRPLLEYLVPYPDALLIRRD